jgi:putative hydrolase of the HAD superfamily
LDLFQFLLQYTMNPKAILFDLDDTILTCEGGDHRKLWRVCVDQHIHHFPGLTAQSLYDEIRQVADEFWSDPDRHRRGRLDIRNARKQIVIQAARNLNHPGDKDAARLSDEYHDRRESNVAPFPGALETLTWLQTTPIRIALITNGSSDLQRAKINKFQLDRYFAHVLVEGEFGRGKPDPAVYRHIVRELGVTEDESWIVGDNLEWEVRVPQQLGFFTIWNDHRAAGLPQDSDVVPDRIVKGIRELVAMLDDTRA